MIRRIIHHSRGLFFRAAIFAPAALLMLSLSGRVMAENKNIGTAGAQFLKIGVGARPTAMGESFVAVADDANAAFYNPSGLAFIERPELTAQHNQWFQGVNHQFGAFAYPTDFGAFALSAITLKVDDIQNRNSDETYQGTFEAMDSAYAVSYAKMLGPIHSMGFTARYVKQEIGPYSADAWAGDAGFMKKFVSVPLSLGLAVRNVGQKIKFKADEDPQPTVFDAGMSASLFHYRVLLAANVFKPVDNDVRFGAGMEFHPVLTKTYRFTLRGGFNSAHTDPEAPGFSFGAGLGIKQMSFDFSYVPFGDLGNTFRYSLGIRF